MTHQRKNWGAVISIGVCGGLCFVGIVRMLSYSLGGVGDFVRHSVVRSLCYNAESRLNAQFFKILATPTVVALFYFFFRWRNSGTPYRRGAAALDRARRLDFKSPVLRGILTSVITLHWLAMEWWKFNVDGFYPWSALEIRSLNIVVLIASQAIAFFGMKYLSFEPLAIHRQNID